jgi:integrase
MSNAPMMPHLRHKLKIFLFSCYTGLRGGDCKKITSKNLRGKFICIEQSKTKKDVSIPITKPLEEIMKGEPEKFLDSGFDFQVNKFSKQLKIILQMAGIEKYISMHCARHSFAINSLELGIDVTVISKVLGHSDLATTMIYVKVRDEYKLKEMAKWDGF